ncbi:hypothetical protein AVEN_112289-1 [Araneus ventricosus]|uniref:Uncharacterized protein n=1 Tax=Araneus ventricosus TaxID=182803 RepID=A0A4Y2P1Y9_ARAVE|nr:hypothetical protein AVEN_112289-1 [Araneus ventricosus]
MLNVDLPVSSSSQSVSSQSSFYSRMISGRGWSQKIVGLFQILQRLLPKCPLPRFCSHVSFDPRNMYMLIPYKALADRIGCCVSASRVSCRLGTRLIAH